MGEGLTIICTLSGKNIIVHPNKSHNDRSELLKKIRQCIRKPNKAPLGDFSLSLEGYKFDRDEANER